MTYGAAKMAQITALSIDILANKYLKCYKDFYIKSIQLPVHCNNFFDRSDCAVYCVDKDTFLRYVCHTSPHVHCTDIYGAKHKTHEINVLLQCYRSTFGELILFLMILFTMRKLLLKTFLKTLLLQ